MKCVTVIPIYKTGLTKSEVKSLLRAKECIGEDVFLIAPIGLDIGLYLHYWPDIKFAYFPIEYFSSVQQYSKFMLKTDLYEYFASHYSWMLIYQLDAFIFKNEIKQFCSYKYDYYGAPWISAQYLSPKIKNPYIKKYFGRALQVGNGGFSLRKISSTIKFLEKYASYVNSWTDNEDAFFAYYGVNDFEYKISPLDLAIKFAFEQDPAHLYQLNNFRLPMGCHGFDKYSPDFYAMLMKYSQGSFDSPADDSILHGE